MPFCCGCLHGFYHRIRQLFSITVAGDLICSVKKEIDCVVRMSSHFASCDFIEVYSLGGLNQL